MNLQESEAIEENEMRKEVAVAAASFRLDFTYPNGWTKSNGIVVCGMCILRKCSTLKLDYVDVVQR